MKRIAILLLLVSYSFSNFGMVLNAHFCSGKLVSASFIGNSSKCGLCGKNITNKKCCQDRQTKLTVDENQQLPDNKLSQKYTYYIGLIFKYFIIGNNSNAIFNKNKFQHYVYKTGPPKTPIYLMLRVIVV